MDEHALWADLDGIKPKELEEYPPTIAWETSPGRYQALWIVQGDIQGASWPGRENQCMTYYIGADLGGWDTTQLLRIPGWKNHKPDYIQQFGEPPQGKLLWSDGRIYLADDFNDLPDVPAVSIVSDLIEREVELVDRHEVREKFKNAVPKRVWEFLDAPETSGDRSDVLWQVERELADAGMDFKEIVALVKHSVWNKYVGRTDEFKRLSTETAKAIAERDEATLYKIAERAKQENARLRKPRNLFELVENIKPPQWLVEDILTQGACGFIAGEPKSYKSFCSLDLAISVATGVPFLDHFRVLDPGKVLWVQEEDPLPLVKKRLDKVYPSKMLDRVTAENGSLYWAPAQESKERPAVDAFVGEHVTLSDGAWQSWLNEVLGEGQYKLCIMDPLMMMAGDVEETRAQQMTEKIFKPLKQLARQHHVAIWLVHHLRKNDPKYKQRGGQLMLGSMANHAWAEDSLYLRRGKAGEIYVEQESKNSTSRGFRIVNLNNRDWTPQVILPKGTEAEQKNTRQIRRADPVKKAKRVPGVLAALAQGYNTSKEICRVSKLKSNTVYVQLKRLRDQGLVTQEGERWTLKQL
jgi:RecA-family ATPase